jgi:hypothetical protein
MAVIVAAQQTINPEERLLRARDLLAHRDQRLPDYACVQTVDRYYFTRRLREYPTPSCDQIRSLGGEGIEMRSSDRLRLDLKISDGSEIGSWKDSQFTSADIFAFIGGGPYGTGAMGALISDIFLTGGASYQYIGAETDSANALVAYDFEVPLTSSHYQVKSGSKFVLTGFHGTFWLDTDSLEPARLRIETDELPAETGGCSAVTTIQYRKVQVGTGTFLVPWKSSIKMLMRDETETEVTAVYSECREYHAETTIRFDTNAVAGEAKTRALSAPVPEGVPFSVALTNPIDTNKAAAGDIVMAKIRKPGRDSRSQAILLPAGAVVHGRIIQMQHWLGKPRHFNISIQLERVEIGGVSKPLYAKVIASPSKQIFLSPIGQDPLVAAFPFMTENGRYVVPVGWESHWITVPAPEQEGITKTGP